MYSLRLMMALKPTLSLKYVEGSDAHKLYLQETPLEMAPAKTLRSQVDIHYKKQGKRQR